MHAPPSLAARINLPGGERELVLGVDDSQAGTESRTVPREDVAEVIVQALLIAAYRASIP